MKQTLNSLKEKIQMKVIVEIKIKIEMIFWISYFVFNKKKLIFCIF